MARLGGGCRPASPAAEGAAGAASPAGAGATEARQRRRRAPRRLRVLEPQAPAHSEPGGWRGLGEGGHGLGDGAGSPRSPGLPAPAERGLKTPDGTALRRQARAASRSRVPAGEGGNPLPSPPPLVSLLLCLAQNRAEDEREPSAKKEPQSRAGGGGRSRPAETPASWFTVDQLCACAGIPSASRMGAPKEEGRL